MAEVSVAGGEGGSPLVSILIVARNTGSYIDAAIRSARQQTLSDIEIVVIDDGSTDDTRERAARHAGEDDRVRVLDGPRAGLVAVRNASFAAARGRWAAILDSDDMLHPRHIEWLVEAAQRTGAEIIGPNMVEFREGAGASLFAEGSEWRSERPIDLISYIAAHHLYGDAVSLGYLKPLLHMGFLRSRGLEYDARLRIGEDYDLVVRAIGAGARFLYLPRPSYFYRRHEASTSHRLARKDLVGLIESADAGGGAGGNEAVRQALAERRASLIDALAHHDAVEALKAKRPFAMLGHLARHPGAVRLMIRSMREAVGKRIARAQKGPAADEDRQEVALLLGAPAAGSAIMALGERLVRAGMPVVRKPLPAPFEEAGLASASTGVKLILLGEPAAADAAPFALAPEAPWVADAGVEHPAVAIHVALGAAGDALDLTTLDDDRLLAALRALPAKQPTA